MLGLKGSKEANGIVSLENAQYELEEIEAQLQDPNKSEFEKEELQNLQELKKTEINRLEGNGNKERLTLRQLGEIKDNEALAQFESDIKGAEIDNLNSQNIMIGAGIAASLCIVGSIFCPIAAPVLLGVGIAAMSVGVGSAGFSIKSFIKKRGLKNNTKYQRLKAQKKTRVKRRNGLRILIKNRVNGNIKKGKPEMADSKITSNTILNWGRS